MPEPFANEPVLEVRRADVRGQFEDALRRVDDELPVQVPVRIGEDARTGDDLPSTDPGSPQRVVASAAVATGAEVDAAVAEAGRGLAQWRAVSAADRARALL